MVIQDSLLRAIQTGTAFSFICSEQEERTIMVAVGKIMALYSFVPEDQIKEFLNGEERRIR